MENFYRTPMAFPVNSVPTMFYQGYLPEYASPTVFPMTQSLYERAWQFQQPQMSFPWGIGYSSQPPNSSNQMQMVPNFQQPQTGQYFAPPPLPPPVYLIPSSDMNYPMGPCSANAYSQEGIWGLDPNSGYNTETQESAVAPVYYSSSDAHSSTQPSSPTWSYDSSFVYAYSRAYEDTPASLESLTFDPLGMGNFESDKDLPNTKFCQTESVFLNQIPSYIPDVQASIPNGNPYSHSYVGEQRAPPPGNSSPKPTKVEICKFCRSNGESAAVYGNHSLKNSEGETTCPILAKHVCPVCGDTGKLAHTFRYCPKAAPNDARKIYRKVRNSVGSFKVLKY